MRRALLPRRVRISGQALFQVTVRFTRACGRIVGGRGTHAEERVLEATDRSVCERPLVASANAYRNCGLGIEGRRGVLGNNGYGRRDAPDGSFSR